MTYLFFALLLVLIQTQRNEDCTSSAGNLYHLGSRVSLCLKIRDSKNTYVYSFAVTVDRITALSITNLPAIASEDNMTLSVQIQNIISADLLIQDFTNTLCLNPISLVLRTENGILSQIYQQSQDCSFCLASARKACVGNICYTRTSFMNQNKLVVYVTWIGTGIGGQHFVSHTIRPQKLSVFSQLDIYNSALQLHAQ